MTPILCNPPVRAMQNIEDLQWVVEKYVEAKPRSVLEIGSFHGATLWCWLMNNPEIERAASIDVMIDGYGGKKGDSIEQMNARLQWGEWVPPGCKFQAFVGKSQNPAVKMVVADYFRYGIDWLYIDGGHEYDEVLEDWETYASLVRPGGHIVFHDVYIPIHEGVGPTRLWEELKVKYPGWWRKAEGWTAIIQKGEGM